MTSWKTIEDKKYYERIITVFNSLKEGLGLTKPFSIPDKLNNDLTDFDILENRLLLLSRVSQYLSLLQGKSLELQKSYKTPTLYGLYEQVAELNKSVRMEADILRSIISTEKELIKLK